ncbi:MAG: DUF4412 domain-containing protein [Chthoniobacteraceae bacterium]
MTISSLRAAALALALCTTARADLVIEQHVTGAGRESDMTLRIKDGQMRGDLTKEISVIAGGPDGASYTLMHEQKRYLRMTKEQLAEMRKQVPDATVGAETAKLEPTGEKAKVGEFETEIYKWKVGKIEAKYWVAPAYPNHQAINAELDKVQQSSLGSLAEGMTPKMSDFPGLVVQTELKMGEDKVLSTIKSVKEEPVDPKVFELPKDYTEVNLPEQKAPAAE